VDRGKASKFDTPVDLPEGWEWIQWQVENIDAIVQFLDAFVVRFRKAPGDMLLIQSPGRLNATLYPGDCIVIRPAVDDSGDQFGIVRSKLAKHFANSETPHLIVPGVSELH
jgi:hypothetical protein